MISDIFDTSGYDAVPRDAKCFALQINSKAPATLHAHLDAIPVDKFSPIGSYGIALTAQFMLVDFDAEHPKRAAYEARLPATWMQQTRRGTHRLYRVPPGFVGRNRKIVLTDDTGRQQIVGDIKVNGYLVGPGSVVAGHTYFMLNNVDPLPAPPWLVTLCEDTQELLVEIDGHGIERERIEYGRNDEELTKIAGFFRHRGFAPAAIATMLYGVIESGILEQDNARPYTRADAQRIARSASKWETGTGTDDPTLLLKPEGWLSMTDASLVTEQQAWWLSRFVPKRALVMLYGKGGIGKSTWASWLAARVTKAGGTFVHVGIEEPFHLFAVRAILMGADRTKLFGIPNGSKLAFPRDADGLGKAIEAAKADFVYFDSIYTHFTGEDGANAAERARKALGPLAEVAQRTGATIMGVFHENKAGDFLGSVEMVNVGRSILHATREEGKPLRITVKKTNGLMPDHHLEFDGEDTLWADPTTGDVQTEVDDDGNVLPVSLKLLDAMVKVQRGTATITEINDDRSAKREENVRQAIALQEQGRTVKEIATELGVTIKSIRRYLGLGN